MNRLASILCIAFIGWSANGQSPGLKTDEAQRRRCSSHSKLENRALVYKCEVNCGILQYPQPEYPAIASAANVSGKVEIQIVVDKTGRVVAARPPSGHPLLLKSALNAACQIRYQPLKVSGRVVVFKTIVKYNFISSTALR